MVAKCDITKVCSYCPLLSSSKTQPCLFSFIEQINKVNVVKAGNAFIQTKLELSKRLTIEKGSKLKIVNNTKSNHSLMPTLRI